MKLHASAKAYLIVLGSKSSLLKRAATSPTTLMVDALIGSANTRRYWAESTQDEQTTGLEMHQDSPLKPTADSKRSCWRQRRRVWKTSTIRSRLSHEDARGAGQHVKHGWHADTSQWWTTATSKAQISGEKSAGPLRGEVNNTENKQQCTSDVSFAGN